jgi:hypothetical protein
MKKKSAFTLKQRQYLKNAGKRGKNTLKNYYKIFDWKHSRISMLSVEAIPQSCIP